VLKKMLPMLTMLVTGYMAKQSGGAPAAAAASKGGGLLGNLVGGLFGNKSSGAKGGAVSGLASLLDMNNDGNPLDDILKLVGKVKK